MRAVVPSLALVSAVALVSVFAACGGTGPSPRPAPAVPGRVAESVPPASGAPAAQPSGSGARRPRPSPQQMDSLRRGVVSSVLASIAGRENEPAGRVFQNVQMFKDMPARDFVNMMNDTYGRSLGMLCTGCHVAGQWASDDRQNKRLAREMQAMVNDMNARQLRNMKNIDEDFRKVTCAMCHRGAGHPVDAINVDGSPALPGPPPGQRPPGA